MKNMLWLAAGVLVAMTSCSKNEETEPVTQGDAIGFKTFVNKSAVNDWTKGTPVTGNTYPTGSSFGVFAYHTTTEGGWAMDGATATPGFMYNQKVTNNAGSYDYSPVKYWPTGANDKVTFFGYSPYADNNGVVLVGTNATAGVPSITYTVPTTVADQVDLMYASAKDKSNEQVGLTFNHALTQVKFSAKTKAALTVGAAVTVTSLKVSGVKMSGTVSLEDGAVDFTGVTAGDLSWADLNASLTDVTTPLSGNEALMLLPQPVTGISVEIAYSVTVTDTGLTGGSITTDYTKTVSLSTTNAWAQAQRINYMLELDLSGNAVEISANMVDWTTETTPGI